MKTSITNLILIAIVVFTCVQLSYSQTTIHLKKEEGVFTVPCSVNGVKLKFIFDTGASNVSISLTEAVFLFKNGYLNDNDIIGKQKFLDATGKISDGTEINIRKLEFSGLVLYNVKASIVNQMNAPLLLGQSAMAKLGKFEFDPNKGTLTILGKSTKENSTTTPSDKELFFTNSKNEEYYIGTKEDAAEIKDSPNNAEAYFKRGIIKFKLKDFSNALVDFNKAIELKPTSGNYYNYRGDTKGSLNDESGARSDYYNAIRYLMSEIQSEPNDADLYYSLGLAQSNVKNWASAINSFTTAIENDCISIKYAYRDRAKAFVEVDRKYEACSDWYIAKNKYNLDVDSYLKSYCE